MAYGKTTISAHVEINPYISSGAKLLDMSLKYNKKILWLFNSNHTIFSSVCYAPSSGLAYDAFPGSLYSLEGRSEGDGDNIPGIGGYDYNIFIADNFMFISTASALCYGNGKRPLSSSDYTRSYYPYLPVPIKEMPFQSVLNGEKASTHIEPVIQGNDIYEWIREQLEMKIDGPNVPMTGDKYNIRNCPYPVSWSTSDPSVATINASTGEISISGHGYITINATYKSVSGQSFSKSKKIMAGVPEFYLDFRYDQGKGYITTARCREREFYYFLNSGDINYEWGLKSGESDIVWISSKDSVFVLPAPADVEPKTIFMRLRSIGGYKSKTYNYTAEIQYPYQYIPNYIVTNSKGEVYSCDNISVSHYYNYSPNQDYTVGMRFPMFEREELLALLQMMKPWGETEMMKFVVNTQSSMRRDLQTAPVFIIYFENFPDEYFSGEISFDDWIPGFK